MKPTPKPKAWKPAKPAKPRPLTVQQERFCEFIAAGVNQTEAYIKAGYRVSREVAKVNACRMLTKANVEAKIAELRKPQTEQALRSKDENLRYLASVIETAIRDIGPDSPLCVEYVEEVIAGGSRGQLKRGQAPSGNEVTEPPVLRRRVKKPDPLRAIELYCRMRGHFEPDRVEVDVGEKTLITIKERAQQMVSAMARKA